MAWIIWLLTSLFYLFEFIHRVAIGVMVPELIEIFSVSSATLGSLSAYYYYSYALAQIPVGILLDYYGTRSTLTIASLCIALGSLIMSITSNILIANIARAIIGFGSAFSFVACLKLSFHWFPKKRFAFIVGLTNLMGVLGAVIGGQPLAHAVDRYGWRSIILFSAFISLSFAINMWFIIKNKDTPIYNISNHTLFPSIKKHILLIIYNKQIWQIALLGGLMVVPIATYTELWGISFLIKKYNLARPAAALISSLTFIGIALGGPLIGWMADNIASRKQLLTIGCILALFSFSLIIYVDIKILWIICLLHIVFGFCTSSMLLCFAINTEQSNPTAKGITIGFTNTIIMGFSASFQTITGYILDVTSTNFNIAFVPLLASLLLALFICYSVKDSHAFL